MKKENLIKMHGTLEEFSNAVWKAANHLFITDEEAKIAIEKYKKHLESMKKNK